MTRDFLPLQCEKWTAGSGTLNGEKDQRGPAGEAGRVKGKGMRRARPARRRFR